MIYYEILKKFFEIMFKFKCLFVGIFKNVFILLCVIKLLKYDREDIV